jgi:hypothetical protein
LLPAVEVSGAASAGTPIDAAARSAAAGIIHLIPFSFGVRRDLKPKREQIELVPRSRAHVRNARHLGGTPRRNETVPQELCFRITEAGPMTTLFLRISFFIAAHAALVLGVLFT